MKYKQLPSFSNPLLKGGWVHSAEISLTLIARLMTLIRAGRKKLFFVTCRETSLSHFSRTSLVQKIKIGKEVFNGYWFPPPTPLGGKHLSPESLFLQQARQFFFSCCLHQTPGQSSRRASVYITTPGDAE